MDNIGRLNESSLHAALKLHYAQPGDMLETRVGGCVIDIVRGDLDGDPPPTLIEIQTGNFSALKPKFAALLDVYPMRVILPLAMYKWIVRIDTDGVIASRRKSPSGGSPLFAFREWVYIAPFIGHPNLTLELVYTHQDEIWRDDGGGSWRRKHWSIADRRLTQIDGMYAVRTPAECYTLFQSCLSAELPDEFTTADVTARLARARDKICVQPAVNALWRMSALVRIGKRGRAFVYRVSEMGL
ncbi:MAG: hypothetical protein SGI73_20425 [Chloroflexota bacterium]|nr:hypothetical protein [Chloroflexota bacterium]